jgi:hypothetical protein
MNRYAIAALVAVAIALVALGFAADTAEAGIVWCRTCG